jgi:hypothetical protein
MTGYDFIIYGCERGRVNNDVSMEDILTFQHFEHVLICLPVSRPLSLLQPEYARRPPSALPLLISDVPFNSAFFSIML